MKTQRRLPFISLIALSVFVCFGALVAVAGIGILSFNWQGTASTIPATDTPIPANTNVPTQTLLPTETPAPIHTGEILLEDDFSQDELTWGTLTEPDHSIEYDGETLRMEMSVDNWFVWSTPNSETYRNIHVEVMVVNNDGAPNTAFGILCNQQDADESYYHLGFTPGGEYAIGLAAAGQTDIFLTNNDEWGKSDVIPRQADSF